MEGKITVAVGAVIRNREGRILLVKHKPERGGFWKGKWICPGGKLEFGESIEEGIRREVKEETGLEVEIAAPLVPLERVVQEGGRTTLHVIYIDYLAKAKGGVLAAGSDVGEARWVAPEALPGIWDELHEDTQRLLRMAGVA